MVALPDGGVEGLRRQRPQKVDEDTPAQDEQQKEIDQRQPGEAPQVAFPIMPVIDQQQDENEGENLELHRQGEQRVRPQAAVGSVMKQPDSQEA